MYITVTMRLSNDLEVLLVKSDSGIVVDQGWNIFLLDYVNLIFV